MRNTFAAIAATGVLTLAALAGTTATAGAATPAAAHSASAAAAASPRLTPYGPFGTAQQCESWVLAKGKWGVYDCKFVQGHWWAFAP
ncbi:hypothetical protein ACIRS1_05725 [Kitasatospora sp. NPDC101176]|uniref:hypothetical protein n=1 Tax=Kitasatospora sp. NPDC101176 TaxID=3364099 RepID=UPI00382128D6